jgi:hypothetical protein
MTMGKQITVNTTSVRCSVKRMDEGLVIEVVEKGVPTQIAHRALLAGAEAIGAKVIVSKPRAIQVQTELAFTPAKRTMKEEIDRYIARQMAA